MSENTGSESWVQTDENGLVLAWAADVPPFDLPSGHADYCGLRGGGPNKICTCPVTSGPPFMGYGSDLPLTEETQAEVNREKAYTDFNYSVEADLHKIYMRINAAMETHESMSREWQELYLAARLVNAAADSLRLNNDRNKNYGKVPF